MVGERMSITEACLAILAALIFVGTLVFAAIQPAIEAEQFNQCTGSNATYWTAATTELRIEKCEAQ